MDELTYLNFDLRIEKSGDKYLSEVTYSPAGEASVEFALPFQAIRREQWLAKPPRELGQALFEVAFGGQVESCLLRSLDKANKPDQGLRIRLRLADEAELVALPWEYLYDTHHKKHLGLSNKTPIVRYMSLPDPVTPLAVEPPLRALVMISSPTNQPSLDVDLEWTRLNEALDSQSAQGLLILERLEEATVGALHSRLQQEKYHIFHSICQDAPQLAGGWFTVINLNVVSKPEMGRGARNRKRGRTNLSEF